MKNIFYRQKKQFQVLWQSQVTNNFTVNVEDVKNNNICFNNCGSDFKIIVYFLHTTLKYFMIEIATFYQHK